MICLEQTPIAMALKYQTPTSSKVNGKGKAKAMSASTVDLINKVGEE